MQIRVLVVDDHTVVRNGVRDVLADESDIDVVGEARSDGQAVELAVALAPDVVVMDVALPDLSGVEATKRIRSLLPATRVLVLSAYDGDSYLFALLEAGATSYVLKTADGHALVRAVRATAAGRAALDPSRAQRIVARAVAPPSVEALSEREHEVLKLAARGLTNKQIGAQLSIDDRTVQNHLASIFGKLSVASRTEALTVALARGLLQLADTRQGDQR